FSIEPKMPLQVTSGDVIQLPVGMVNGLSRELRAAQVTVNGPGGIQFDSGGDNSATLRAKERMRRVVQLDVGQEFTGLAKLTFDANAASYRDSLGRTLDLQLLGFANDCSIGGLLEGNASKSFELTLPSDFVRGSLSASVSF